MSVRAYILAMAASCWQSIVSSFSRFNATRKQAQWFQSQGFEPRQAVNTRAAVQKRLAKERAKKQSRARDKYINYAKRK